MRTIMSCPFCNGEATVGANEYYDGANTFYIYCTSCGVQQMTTKIRTDESIAAWNRRAQPENEALTLDELRQMDGEPVYVVTLDNPLENQPYWAIAGINSNDSRYQNGVALYNRVQDDWGAFDLYGDTWLAYRRKPERSEG